MVKKIFDIFPPKEESPIIPKNNSFFNLKVKFFVFVISILIIIFLTFYYTATVNIQLHPFTENFKLEKNLSIVFGNDKVIQDQNTLKGEAMVVEEAINQEFLATGESEGSNKSEGKVILYNSVNPPRVVKLVKNTRLLSAQGKIFRLKKEVSIPQATISGNKIIPGQIEVEVIADEAGEEYNIPPTKFSVPGLAGSATYSYVWGESKENMRGGSKSSVKMVSSKDLDDANKIIETKLKEKITSKIKEQSKDNYLIFKDAISNDNIEISCDHKEKDITDKFICIGKINAKIPVIKTNTLLNYFKQSQELLKLNKNFVENSEYFDYSLIKNNFPDQIDAKIILNVKTFESIPIGLLKSKIQGRSEAEIENIIFQEYPQIKDVKIFFKPSWIKRAPSDEKRIKIDIIFN